jgi:methylmalonyl-CoA mutase C-terminal domain/subunit
MTESHPMRVVLAKVGLDGHDRGIKVVARALRDAGMQVIYAGLWQTPEAVVRTLGDEDAAWLGLSILVGGIIPESDIPKLLEMGVARVFGPGTPLPDIISFLHERSGAGHA